MGDSRIVRPDELIHRDGAHDRSAATVLRNIRVNGRRTSMRLEPEMWATLEEISRHERVSVTDLCSDIDRGRGPMSLTAAVRSRIVHHLRGGTGSAVAVNGRVSELIRRYRSAERDRSFLTSGGDYEDTITFDTRVISRSADGYLADILEAWRERRSTLSRVPSFEDLAGRAAMLGHENPVYSVIDVSAENPANFVIDRICAFTRDRFQRSFDWTPVSAFPYLLHAKAMQIDFHAARLSGEPIYQISRQRFGACYRDYKRLLVPMSAHGGKVTHLLSVVEPLSGRYMALAAELRTTLPA